MYSLSTRAQALWGLQLLLLTSAVTSGPQMLSTKSGRAGSVLGTW